MLWFRASLALCVTLLSSAHAAIDIGRTSALLREGERFSASTAAELEAKIGKKPNDLENRLRLLSYYAGLQTSDDIQRIRAVRARHVLWLIRNEPKAAIFDIATRVYSIQPAGGALADPVEFQAAKEAWQRQVSEHPNDNKIKRNAATFLDIHDPVVTEALLKSTGDSRWLGQVYAKAILGIAASDYRTSDPVLTTDESRNSDFAKRALSILEASNNAEMLGGAGFTLCRDGGFLYADAKLDWDYVPLAKRLLARAEEIDPSNRDAFSVVPELPKRGDRPAVTVRLGGAQLEQNLKKRIDPVRPAGVARTNAPVRVNVLVGQDGTVVRAVAFDGPVELRSAAIIAVKQWLFWPTPMNGKAVYVLSVIDLSF